MLKKLTIGFVSALVAFSVVPAGQPDLWIHVFVDESGENGETVRVNLPLSVVEDVLPHIAVDEFQRGKVRIVEEMEAEGVDVRAMWEGLRTAEDGDFVTVRSDGENVRVSKSGGYFLVNVDEQDEKVRVRIPIDVVDALFSGEDDELDVLAAVRALGNHAGEDIVTVEEGDSTVRIWIDNDPEGRL